MSTVTYGSSECHPRATHSPTTVPAIQVNVTGATSRVRGLTRGSAKLTIWAGPWAMPS